MEPCPFNAIAELDSIAWKYIRLGQSTWGSLEALQLDRSSFYPMIPDILRMRDREFRRIPTPPLAWHEGLCACQVKIPSGRWATHFHANLTHGQTRVHVDYFHFVESGPVRGIEGFAISRDGSVLVAGGHWGQPPGGGERNWPLAVDLGPVVLSAYGPCLRDGRDFHCDGAALWDKGNP